MVGFQIDPTTWYSERELRLWGFDADDLAGARAAGLLRCIERGERGRLYLGAWVSEWLVSQVVNA